jgi:hypothetical protein
MAKRLTQSFTLQFVGLKDVNDINILSICVYNVYDDDGYKH